MENRTLEAPPEGTVTVSAETQGSREARVRWDAPFHPNGRLTYSVLVTGTFYADQGNSRTLFKLHECDKTIYLLLKSSLERQICIPLFPLEIAHLDEWEQRFSVRGLRSAHWRAGNVLGAPRPDPPAQEPCSHPPTPALLCFPKPFRWLRCLRTFEKDQCAV